MTQERAQPVFLFTHGVLENQMQGLSRTMSIFKDFQSLRNDLAYVVSGGALNSTHSLAWKKIKHTFKDFQWPASTLRIHPGRLVHLQLVT